MPTGATTTSFISALRGELAEHWSLSLVAALFIVALLARKAAREERRRLLTAALLVAGHLACVAVAAWQHAGGAEAHPAVRALMLLFAAFAAIGLAGTLIFGLTLPALRLRSPRILREVLSAGAGLVALLAVASRAGFNLTGLIATSAVATAVIGFSLQDTLGNIMGGLALQMDDSVRVGDWVKLGDVVGRVAEIRWRYTAIETRNWETVLVPNSQLVKGQVTVLGRRIAQPTQLRRWVYFNVDFRYQPSDVIAAVESALRARPIENVAATPPPNCILIDLSESYGRYAVRYWLTDLSVDDPTDSVVRTRVYFALQRSNMKLSIPAHAVFVTEESAARRESKERAGLEQRVNVLRKVELFADLPDGELASLAARLRYAPFTCGETLTQQGAEAHWLYIILDGEVSVRVRGEGGLEREVARLGPGRFFGEMSLMTGEPRSATVVGLTDVECYRLDRGAFEEVVHKRPALAEQVAAILAHRNAELAAVREGLDAEARQVRLAHERHALTARIRDFFGLGGDA